MAGWCLVLHPGSGPLLTVTTTAIGLLLPGQWEMVVYIDNMHKHTHTQTHAFLPFLTVNDGYIFFLLPNMENIYPSIGNTPPYPYTLT